MATYNMGEWPHSPQKKIKQKFSVVTRTIDFRVPPTEGSTYTITAWAANDIIEFIGIRAGQTVLGLTVDVKETLAGGRFEIGDGTWRGRWGSYNMDIAGPIDPHSGKVEGNEQYLFPHTYTTNDTIDIRIQSGTPTSGRAKICVYLVEDARK